MQKTFFSEKEAKEMARKLRALRYDTWIWVGRDGFGQITYTLKWN